ncbi:11331_t:CDS:10 [Racocetra fulgida]|uniref:11331_t:CDS:1 n=1 Tax=Racocetra fulgida TaxID=60492 RepID=A0A9N8VGT4_9GLOM|nr:11331_t:CDS:10 [Racocetra fulgida]
MTLKQKIELLNKEFTTLKQKINAKLQANQQTITQKDQQLAESNRNLETALKENTENEKDNMLREEILRSWNAYKQKVSGNKKNQLTNSEREFFELLSGNLMDINTPKEDILKANMRELKHKRNALNDEYNEIYQKYVNMSFSEDYGSVSFHLDLTYMAYSNINRIYGYFVQALGNVEPVFYCRYCECDNCEKVRRDGPSIEEKINVSGNFTTAEDLVKTFLKVTGPRQKAKEKNDPKFAGDAGYWKGSHKLDEDAEVLANFFNSIANITDDINNIKLSANETIFSNNKQQLIAKIQGLIGKCRITSSTSIDNFSVKLQRNLTAVEKLEPKHQKEILDLEKEAREAESAYKENLQKADNETDPEKKAEFIVLANKAAKKAEEIKRKVKNNPIAQLANFNYLDDLRALQGNVPPNVCPDRQPGGRGSGNNSNGGGSGSGQTPNPLEDPKSFFEQNKMMIVVALGLVGILLYIFLQKDSEDDEEAKEEKKNNMKKQQQQLLITLLLCGVGYYFLVYLPEEENKKKTEREKRQAPQKIVNGKKSSLLGEYQKFASLFPDGDRNEKFYFSRAAPYTVYFPPSLQSYYEKGKELELEESVENPTRGNYEKGLGNNALFYGAPGTGKTETMRNLCVKSDKYPLVVVVGSDLTPTDLVKDYGLEREENGEVRYILFVDEANQISNNSLIFQSNGLKFLKDCLEGVDKDESSENLPIKQSTRFYLKLKNEKEVDIEIGEFLEFFWHIKEKYSTSFDGVYESVQKPTLEKVLESSLNNLTRIINGKLDEIIEQLEPDEDDGEENIIVKLQSEVELLKDRKKISYVQAAVGICVASAGAATPFVSAVGGYLIGDKADKESAEREKLMMQDGRYKDANQEVDKQANQNNQTKNIIEDIVAKLNGNKPRQSHETDEHLKQQLAIAQNSLKDGESRLQRLRGDVDKLRKELGGGGNLLSLLGLDKLSFADKVIIAGGIVLTEKGCFLYFLQKKKIEKGEKYENIRRREEDGLKANVENEELSADDYKEIKKFFKKLNRAEKQKELDDPLIKEEIKSLQNSLKELEEHASPRTQDQASSDKSRQRKAKKKCRHEQIEPYEDDLNNYYCSYCINPPSKNNDDNKNNQKKEQQKTELQQTITNLENKSNRTPEEEEDLKKKKKN